MAVATDQHQYIGIGTTTCGSHEHPTYTIIPIVISTVGIFISVTAFIILVVTATLFKEWRQSRKNQLLIQFMLARLLYIIMTYVFDLRSIFNFCDAMCVIYLDKILFVYTEIALICWMFVFSKTLNDSLVKVFNTSEESLWKLSLWTWLIPVFVSAILYTAFAIQEDKDLTIFLLYIFILKWPVLCVNAILLITALATVIKSNKSKTENNVRIVIVMILLIFGFSIQQFLIDIFKIIHLMLYDYYITLWLYIINTVNIYYCAFSILFWLFGNSKTRKLWSADKPKVSSPSQLSFRISVQ